jgi:hypothetical protein
MGGLMFDEAEGCAGATMGERSERLTAMGERMMRSCGDGRVDYLPPEDGCYCSVSTVVLSADSTISILVLGGSLSSTEEEDSTINFFRSAANLSKSSWDMIMAARISSFFFSA